MLIHEPLVYVLVVAVIVLSLMVTSEIVGKAQMREELRQLKEKLVQQEKDACHYEKQEDKN